MFSINTVYIHIAVMNFGVRVVIRIFAIRFTQTDNKL